MPGSKREDNRTRNWNFVVYPDSAPENWREIIDETRIEWVESPLHDRDIDPDGEPKKPHYHVTLLFPSMKSFDQVSDLVMGELFQPIPIKCMSVKGSIRYMVHKDNPEKYQYDWNDIKCHGGADLDSLCAPTNTERMILQREIFGFIRDNNITELADLVNMAMDAGYNDWLSIIWNFSTISITAYIKSLRYKQREEE